ncbi:GNAT family N-acetyltransferase [Fundicoccus culcitae]|uniref:GNAT family N-acetyltransferase n=1 Tax=Fundicoccus culcitae TaxID=2969821 RepID=A0ABY5P4K4_9LACT|nr:GNAT family N-acetyltransferase [Fundicoccus culcitae]UUX33684.1 GNAT family N-acetyltransferase [Fundicoccus culcitae]
MAFIIRKPLPADAEALAKVHVSSWQTSYQGIVPNHFLQSLSVEDRQKRFTEIIANANHFFVLTDNNQIVGFVGGGEQRHPAYANYPGEIYSIYLYQESQGHGGGRLLFEAMQQSLLEAQLNPMTVVVLSKNVSAIAFYEQMGGKPVGKDTINIGGDDFEEIIYGWELH